MDSGTLSGITTALCLLAFLAVVAWAYGRGRKSDFEAAAQLPLDDSDVPAPVDQRRPGP